MMWKWFRRKRKKKQEVWTSRVVSEREIQLPSGRTLYIQRVETDIPWDGK